MSCKIQMRESEWDIDLSDFNPIEPVVDDIIDLTDPKDRLEKCPPKRKNVEPEVESPKRKKSSNVIIDLLDLARSPAVIPAPKKKKTAGENSGRLVQSVISFDNTKRTNQLSITSCVALPNDYLILAIDPGPVNCGMCVFSITKKMAVKSKPVAFRQTNESISVEVLIDRVKKYVAEDPDGLFSRCCYVYVEQQDNNRSNLAIQYCIQTLLGSSICRVVQSSAVKARYKKYFPDEEKKSRKREAEEEPTEKGKNWGKKGKKQWGLNKKHSVINGIATMRPEEYTVMSIRGKSGRFTHNHNCFDALWIARYACEKFHDVDLEKIEKSGGAAKKKRSKKDDDTVPKKKRKKLTV